MNILLILASGIRTTTPLLLAAIGGMFNQHAGLMNIGLEGLMLLSAFAAAVAGYLTGSLIFGMFFAVVVGVLFALLFAWFIIKLRANWIIIGLGMNLLAVGLCGYLMKVIFGVKGVFLSNEIPKLFPIFNVGTLKEFDVLVYLSWVFVFLSYYLIYKTRFGLRLRALGENPDATFSLGVNVNFYRYVSFLFAGTFCGLAGSHLVFRLQIFSKDITAGRGFIAFAAILFGSANPFLTALACVVFGFAESLQIRFQSMAEIPPQIIQMIPYFAVVLALILKSLREVRREV